MPKFLTITDDLQIVVDGDGCAFLSRTHCTLEHAEQEVTAWLEDRPDHPRREQAKQWLCRAGDKIIRLNTIRGFAAKRISIEQTKREIRRTVHDYLWARKVKFADLERKTDELSEQIAREILGYE